MIKLPDLHISSRHLLAPQLDGGGSEATADSLWFCRPSASFFAMCNLWNYRNFRTRSESRIGADSERPRTQSRHCAPWRDEQSGRPKFLHPLCIPIDLRISDFGFLSDFGYRSSDLEFGFGGWFLELHWTLELGIWSFDRVPNR